MQIFTSCFAQIRKLPDNIVPVSIALKTPAWFQGIRYPALAPHGTFFAVWKRNHDDAEYLRRFNQEVLAPLDAQAAAAELQSLSGGKDIVLLCYEKPSDFCHRHRVAEWFTERGISVSEWNAFDQNGILWEQDSLF
ncbi:MAG: DUF488 domain-containing protein [Oscillospiraceae bacterium]|nr:DUF488 domain-containing protein [Oscillospiraceae bacterium]